MHQPAYPTTLPKMALARGPARARWMPEARGRRHLAATAQRLGLAVIMVTTFALGTAVLAATSPTADQTGQPLEAPPGLDL